MGQGLLVDPGAQKLIELQRRVSYQDDTWAQLNDVITEQDSIIRILQKQIIALAKNHDEMNYSQEQQGSTSNPTDERPPHY